MSSSGGVSFSSGNVHNGIPQCNSLLLPGAEPIVNDVSHWIEGNPEVRNFAGIGPLIGGVDRMVPGFLPPTMDERQFSGASDHSDGEGFSTSLPAMKMKCLCDGMVNSLRWP